MVPLPSGVVPETVEFNFEGTSPFQSQAFSLTYEWPEKLFMPEVIFKVDMRSDKSVDVNNDFMSLGRRLGKLASIVTTQRQK